MTKIEPALTALVRLRGRWRWFEAIEPPDDPDRYFPIVTPGRAVRVGHWSSLGEVFGFTHEDVVALRTFTSGLMSKGYGGPGGPLARQLDDLADRIEYLLPPEAK